MSELHPEEVRRQLAELADDLLEQIRELKRQYAELDAILAGEAVPDAIGEHAVEADEAARRSQQAQHPLRLIALEMALSGQTRDEVAGYLREAYGVDPDTRMLDSVFSRLRG